MDLYTGDRSPTFYQVLFLLLIFLAMATSLLGVTYLFYANEGYLPPPWRNVDIPVAALMVWLGIAAMGVFAVTATALAMVETGRLNNSPDEYLGTARAWPVLALLTGVVTLIGRDLIVWALDFAGVINDSFVLPSWPSYALAALTLLGATAVLWRQLMR